MMDSGEGGSGFGIHSFGSISPARLLNGELLLGGSSCQRTVV
jgi:hypothetical protein